MSYWTFQFLFHFSNLIYYSLFWINHSYWCVVSQQWCCNLLCLVFLPYLTSVSVSCRVTTNLEETLLLSVCSGHDATSLWADLSSRLICSPQTLSPGVHTTANYQSAAPVVAVLLHQCLYLRVHIWACMRVRGSKCVHVSVICCVCDLRGKQSY